jgi:peptidoglycan/xylan/chitin deacetylase (PgdA/CDA1 family)
MKLMILNSIYQLAYYIGVFDIFYRTIKKPIVITYHNIIPDDLFNENIHFIGGDHRVSEFDAQLEIIKSKVDIGNRIEPGKVLITLDDGYTNNHTIVGPILRKHGVSATFFVPACYFESTDMLWVDRLLMWLSFVPEGTYSIANREYNLTGQSSRKEAWNAIWDLLNENYSIKKTILQDIEKAYSVNQLPIDEDYFNLRFEVLRKENIALMKADGDQIGCHSYNHDILSKLSPTELQQNFERCEPHRENYNVDWFSYPFGRENEVSGQVVERCKAFGYSAAFMNVNRESEDSFRVARINMPNSVNKALIHAKLCGFEALLKKVLRMR